jgi:hypothetical protein
MPQKFAFTTAAMAAALEETPVSYEDLADIEREFDDAETEISESYPVLCSSWMRGRNHIRSINAQNPWPTNNTPQ